MTGLSCDHCLRPVTQALKNTEGVRDAQVDLKGALATVDYDEAKTSPRALAEAVTEEGYAAEEIV